MLNKIKRLSFILFITLITITVTGQNAKSFKRGLAYDIPYAEDVTTLSEGLSWFYNWGTSPGLNVKNMFDPYMVYLPMCWNGVDTVALKSFYSNYPNIKYIMGFNEPNFKSQANLTPTQAAAKWPLIERIAKLYNLKIVGPALNYCSATGAVSEKGVTYTDPIKYYDDFFAACPDCQVDYVAVHNYMNSSIAVVNDIARYKKYNKPIWLTEFCEYDGSQTLTTDTQKDYMVDLLNSLENDTCVYRYSWFIGRNGNGAAAFPYNSLLTDLMTNADRGKATELGDVYLHMMQNDKNFYYSATDTIQAEKFSNEHSASLRRLDSITGNLYLNDFYFKDWVIYHVNLPETKEYHITFRIACIPETTIQVLDSMDNILSSQDMTTTGGLTSWGYRTLKVTLPGGKQDLKLKSLGYGCNIDWFTFKTIDTAVQPVESSPIVNLYPNPIGDNLYINTQENTTKIVIYNVLGKKVFEGTNEKKIDTKNLERGIYVVKLDFDNGKTVSTKIMK